MLYHQFAGIFHPLGAGGLSPLLGMAPRRQETQPPPKPWLKGVSGAQAEAATDG